MYETEIACGGVVSKVVSKCPEGERCTSQEWVVGDKRIQLVHGDFTIFQWSCLPSGQDHRVVYASGNLGNCDDCERYEAWTPDGKRAVGWRKFDEAFRTWPMGNLTGDHFQHLFKPIAQSPSDLKAPAPPSDAKLDARTRLIYKAKTGDPEAQYELGFQYESGRDGFPVSPEQSAYWFEQAAKQGYQNAAYAIGRDYLEGWGVPRDPVKAVDWLERSAAKADLQAYSLLQQIYEQGQGVPKDFVLAQLWYRKGEDRWEFNDKARFVDRYRNELQSPELMAARLLSEAEAGDQYAQFNLGFALYRGRGVPRDVMKALTWFDRAAAQGNVAAMYIAGLFYELGIGTPKDKAKAVNLYRMGAEQNDQMSQVRLGR